MKMGAGELKTRFVVRALLNNTRAVVGQLRKIGREYVTCGRIWEVNVIE